ncbi:HAD family hydrolase [Botrimarina sp.]|uniref:HAD family hydrolase n=1 Tax=Botrimarina sp. TaxID=2795802 RepID=UPI0032ED1180
MLSKVLLTTFLLVWGWQAPAAAAEDPLPSWNDTPAKQAIVDFVQRVTDRSGDHFVPPAERIATFDNDGTLWAEQPAYFQLLFAFDRVRAMAGDHPEWRHEEPFKSVLAGDYRSAAASGKEGLVKVLAASHTGMTADDFRSAAKEWLATSEHPTLGRRYADCLYQPQLELLEYLRANGFKTFIVSGGGIDFLRAFAEEAYGIPPEQVVGTSIDATYEFRDGVPVIVKQPSGLFVDDKAGKPVGIYQHIGRRPILAVGNSDGDFQMLEYTTTREGPSLGVLVHHTDAEREFAYDRDSHVGKLDRGLDEAPQRGWVVVDMAKDWSTVFGEAP